MEVRDITHSHEASTKVHVFMCMQPIYIFSPLYCQDTATCIQPVHSAVTHSLL